MLSLRRRPVLVLTRRGDQGPARLLPLVTAGPPRHLMEMGSRGSDLCQGVVQPFFSSFFFFCGVVYGDTRTLLRAGAVVQALWGSEWGDSGGTDQKVASMAGPSRGVASAFHVQAS